MISVSNVILLTAFYSAFFWGVALLFSARSGNAKLKSAFFMLCGSVSFLSAVLFFGGNYNFYAAIYTPVVFFTIAQFPALYIYIFTLTEEKKTNPLIYLHYAIPLFVALMAFYFMNFQFDKNEARYFVSEILTGRERPGGIYIQVYQIEKITKLSFIVFGLIYYTIINLRVKKHRLDIQNYFSNIQDKTLGWIVLFNVFFFLTFIAGAYFHFHTRSSFIAKPDSLILPFTSLTFFYWIVGYSSFKQPQIYKFKVEANSKDSIPLLAETYGDELINKIETLINIKKCFLNPEITLPDLAQSLGTNRTYLSQVINQHYNKNFNQFINHLRIEEAKKIITERTDCTIIDISHKCGFNSYNSFVRSFKLETGITPGKYAELLKQK